MKITSDQQWTTPSWVLQTAANDLKLLHADDKYEVNMGHFLRENPDNKEVCMACLAGAVMAKTLEIKLTKENEDSLLSEIIHIDESIYNAISGLDVFRRGMLRGFFGQVTEQWDAGFPEEFPDILWDHVGRLEYTGALSPHQIENLIELCEYWSAKFKSEGY